MPEHSFTSKPLDGVSDWKADVYYILHCLNIRSLDVNLSLNLNLNLYLNLYDVLLGKSILNILKMIERLSPEYIKLKFRSKELAFQSRTWAYLFKKVNLKDINMDVIHMISYPKLQDRTIFQWTSNTSYIIKYCSAILSQSHFKQTSPYLVLDEVARTTDILHVWRYETLQETLSNHRPS